MPLGVEFPPKFRALCRAADGAFGGPGQWFIIWPLATVVAHHRGLGTAGVPGVSCRGPDLPAEPRNPA